MFVSLLTRNCYAKRPEQLGLLLVFDMSTILSIFCDVVLGMRNARPKEITMEVPPVASSIHHDTYSELHEPAALASVNPAYYGEYLNFSILRR